MADEKYHIEGDTVIFNNGVTIIEEADFHTYDENEDEGYEDVKDETFQYFKKVVLPDSVTEIGDRAFALCKSLTDITIPDSVTSIDDCAFSGCRSLTSIDIPSSVRYIGSSAFRGCVSLKGITIPNSVTNIDEWTFGGCDSFTSIIIPNSVTSIGRCAFYNCTNLTSIDIPSSVKSIGNSAFTYCESLKSITIPSSVKSIGYEAFSGCTSLTNVTIPDSVTSIGNHAFYDCKNLKSITIPNSVTSIDEFAFWGCENLTIVCNKGSYAEKYAKLCNIPIEYIDEHTKEQALSQIKDYINTLAEAMKHYDGKGDVGTYLEGYVGSSGAELGAFLSETSAAYIRNCFVSAYSGVDFNDTEDKSPKERYETRINSAIDKATSLAEELVNKSEKTSVKEIVDDVMQNEDFKSILKNELNAKNDYYFSQEDYDNRLNSYTEEYNEVKAEILEIHKDAINSGKMSEQDINEMIGTDMNTDYPVKEDCAVYIRDIKDTIIENGAGTLTLDDFGDKHYNVQIKSDSEIYTFKVSLPVSKTVGGVKVQGFKELGYIDVGKDEVGKTLKEIAENTAVVVSRKNGSKSLNEIFKDNKGKSLD